MRLGVDVQVQGLAFLAVGRARHVFGAVGHDDLNVMIIRVNFGFHGKSSGAARPQIRDVGYEFARSISQDRPQNKLRTPFASTLTAAYWKASDR